MAGTTRTRTVNPRLGTYTAIFVASFVAVGLLALIIEQAGTSPGIVPWLLFAVPLAAFVGIGFATRATTALDFFAAGRRVPPAYNGLVLSLAGLGGTGLVVVTGLITHIGFDALCFTLGWTSGFVFMVVLLAPYLRKYGAYTVPAYLARRFDNRLVGVVAAATMAVPILLMLAAELSVASGLAALLTGLPAAVMVLVLAGIAAATIIAGGMRSLTWSATAQAFATLVAIAIPVTIVAVLISNMPLPQLTHGNMLRTLARIEIAKGVPTVLAPPFLFEVPGPGLEPMIKQFLQSFGNIGSGSFIATLLTVAAGIAAAPWLLPRTGVATGVYDARNSVGWAVLITGIVCLTLPAAAVYLRGLIVEQVVGNTGGPLPVWFQTLQQMGFVSVDAKGRTVTLASIALRRDAALFALPIAAGLPLTVYYLAVMGALATALAAAASMIHALGSILAEDGFGAARIEPDTDARRLLLARLAILVAAIVGAWIALLPADPLRLALYALSFSAAGGFPVLVQSVLWKRMTSTGAIAGLVTGTGVAAVLGLMIEVGVLDLAPTLAGAIAMALSTCAVFAGSLATHAPGRHVLEFVRDLRVPGGETMYDREQRLARRRQQRPT